MANAESVIKYIYSLQLHVDLMPFYDSEMIALNEPNDISYILRMQFQIFTSFYKKKEEEINWPCHFLIVRCDNFFD